MQIILKNPLIDSCVTKGMNDREHDEVPKLSGKFVYMLNLLEISKVTGNRKSGSSPYALLFNHQLGQFCIRWHEDSNTQRIESD